MKNLNRLLTIALISCLGIGLLFSFTQRSANATNAEDGHYVTMMTTEVHGKNITGSEIEICYGPGNIEKVPLKEYSSVNRQSNLETVANTLNKLRKEGYVLVDASVAVTNIHKTELFIFKKE